jgi:type III secretion system YscD/HrpQ family protein
MLIDREGERQTIVSPLLTSQTDKPTEKSEAGATPVTSAAASAKEALGGIQEAILPPAQSEVERIKEAERKEARLSHAISGLVVLVAITGLFVVIGVGTTMLFKTEEVPQEQIADADTLIARALKDYATVRYSFNPAAGKLLLVGHVLTGVDRSKILDNLQDLKFISQIDYSNIIIDEDVWRETNQVLAKNPAWQSVTVSSPTPGKFVLNGFLKTRKQADDLYDYMSHNFAYPNLLERHVVVEEELKAKIAQQLDDAGFRSVQTAIDGGAITLTGTIANGTLPAFTGLVNGLKNIPGIKTVQSFVAEVAPEQTLVNLSDQYHVAGYSVVGKDIYVVIDNRILRKGDILDGRRITDIQRNAVFLEKDGVKYRIDFNR